MKAVQMSAAGAPDVLVFGEIPEPRLAAPSQIKVRLHAAGINPVDTKIRARGLFQPGAQPPAVLGCDGAGEVVEIGSGVTRFRVGDRVWFCNGGLGGEQGNYAEFTLVDEAVAQPLPAAIDFPTAAAAPLVLITAWEALFDRAHLQAGQHVLIHAGAGGVGHVAIQLAKQAGARVAVTVGSPEKAAFVRALGADEAFLYKEQDFVAATNRWTEGKGADIVFDCVGGETFRKSIDAVAHYGDLITLLDPGTDVVWKEARNRNLRIGFVLMLTPMLRHLPEVRAHQGEILRLCGERIARGELRIEVARTFPLDQAAEAHRLIEQGHVQGKLVLVI